MPRIKFIFTLFVFSVCLSAPVLAAGDTAHRLDALGMTVSIPDDLITFTRDTAPDDPLLMELGYDAQALLEFFESKYIYLDAVAEDFSHEYSIKMPELGDMEKPDDFNLYSGDALMKKSGALAEALETAGGSGVSIGIYENDHTKYFLVQFTQTVSSVTTYTEMYYTFAGGKPVSISLDSYGQMYSGAQEETLRHIVDSVTFDRLASGMFTITQNGFYVLGYNIGKVTGAVIAGAVIGGICGIILTATKRSRRKRAAAALDARGGAEH